MFFIDIFNTVLFRPILNVLIYLYNFLPGEGHLGWAIILLTVIISIILWPVSQKGFKAQRAMQQLQPKIKELQNKHKNDKQKQSQEMMKFYRENKVSPLSSCLPLIIQGIVLIGLYQALRIGLGGESLSGELYSWVSDPGELNTNFLGMNLGDTRNIILAVLAGIFQLGQSWLLMYKRKKDPLQQKADAAKQKTGAFSDKLTRNMAYLTPLITVWFGFVLPAGLALYWAARSLFSVGQQAIIIWQEKRERESASGAPGDSQAGEIIKTGKISK